MSDEHDSTDGPLVREAGQLRDVLVGAWSKVEDAEAARRVALDARERVEREANALAAVVADVLNGRAVDDVVDDLPHDARRRVIAYRHQSSPMAGVSAQDQFGRLPVVPPRASVMRDRVRVWDADDTDLSG